MGTFEQIKNDLTEAMTAKQGTQPYDTVAQVVRVDGNIAWVHIPGGVDETPVAMTVNAKSGDSVRVRVSGGSAWITGSDSAPPTDDRMANIANTRAVEANTKAASAEQLAEEASIAAGSALGIAQTAQQIADNTAQHFWFTETGSDTGAHIAEVTQEEFETSPTGANLLARSNGIAVRDGETELATFGQKVVLGSGSSYAVMAPDGLGITLDGGASETFAAHLYDGSDTAGSYPISSRSMYKYTAITVSLNDNIAIGKAITLDLTLVTDQTYTETVTLTAGTYADVLAFEYNGMGIRIHYSSASVISIANTYNQTVTLSGTISYTIKNDRSAYFTLGQRASGSSIGKYSVAEGYDSEASGNYSHAEGGATATNSYAHAEGEATAGGTHSHAECLASAAGPWTHAEGSGTATGQYSHAQNRGTIASSANQTVIGKYNVSDEGYATYALIVGNGTGSNARADALQLEWDGEVNIALSTTGTSGTDYDLYTAITSLGWDADVIE